MVMVNFSKDKLKELNLSSQELEEILFKFGFEIDEENEEEFKIDVTHDRSDCFHAYGLLRALKAYIGQENKKIIVEKEENYEVIVDESVNSVRPYTVCAIFKNINFTDEKIKEMINIQEKLHITIGRNRKNAAIGIYPYEKIKFPIIFKADIPEKIKFHPLNSLKEMTGKQIVEEHEVGIKYAQLLEGKKEYPFFIDSNNNILSMPPIINSELTGRVNINTKSVFVECSGDNLNTLNEVLNILSIMFFEFGAKIIPVKVIYNKELNSKSLKEFIFPNLFSNKKIISKKIIKEIIGEDLENDEIISLLKKMQYEEIKQLKEGFEVSIPSYRTDLWHEVDIADDILRAKGIMNLEPIIPQVQGFGEEQKSSIKKEKIEKILTEIGFNQVMTLALTNFDSQITQMKIDEKKIKLIEEIEPIQVGNSVESGVNMVRFHILPELLKLIYNNQDKELPLKLFELDQVAQIDRNEETLSRNIFHLALTVSDTQSQVTYLRQIIDYLSRKLGIEFIYEEYELPFYIEGRCVLIKQKDKFVGYLGEVLPEVLDNFQVSIPTSSLEINLDLIDID